ncbi:hypothetical protein BOTCAL_0010g00010 [Botryotinia calthae]|uniref:Acyl-CoA thioesterase-like N-terminal HotDog domain-containing protein n=1 Tax=Botryotinia calthae TaxID=38488 RepID=A0A4Y8DGT3_9HELO|nr:hypothetical protein BOTCAL_0010g00010 [Botryotinia calthae]
MSQNAIETPPSLPDVLAQTITCIKKGEYKLDLPSSFSFGPRIFGGLVMSMTHQAVQDYFSTTHRAYNQPDVLSMQWQFFRLLFPSVATLSIKEIHLGKSSSTILVIISQKGKECMIGFMK